MTNTIDADAFEAARPKLMAIAYRMLGSVVEAEDVVGDVAERWSTMDVDAVRNSEAWLVTVTTRRALDVLRSARLQRESYPGVWLPEPIATGDGPGDELERRETMTMGFLLLLERLTPIERAVLVLHDVLDHPYSLIAEAVGRTEAACRQALHRARQHVTVPAARPLADRARAERVASRFLTAGLCGDVEELLATLSPDVVVTSDGGGVVHAAMRPVRGRDRALRFLGGLGRNLGDDPLMHPCELNGAPGFVTHTTAGWAAMLCEVAGDQVTEVRMVVNPEKLERLLAAHPDLAAGRPGPFHSAGWLRHRGGRPVARPSVG
ncbi:MAG: RNA polymerase sigma factor SigJ [Ilumatobacteraceae bacterium]